MYFKKKEHDIHLEEVALLLSYKGTQKTLSQRGCSY